MGRIKTARAKRWRRAIAFCSAARRKTKTTLARIATQAICLMTERRRERRAKKDEKETRLKSIWNSLLAAKAFSFFKALTYWFSILLQRNLFLFFSSWEKAKRKKKILKVVFSPIHLKLLLFVWMGDVKDSISSCLLLQFLFHFLIPILLYTTHKQRRINFEVEHF